MIGVIESHIIPDDLQTRLLNDLLDQLERIAAFADLPIMLAVKSVLDRPDRRFELSTQFFKKRQPNLPGKMSPPVR